MVRVEMLKPLAVVIATLLSLSCASSAVSASPGRPKSVILVIGDGMGSAQFTAARLLRGQAFQTGRAPVTGWVTTQSANAFVPDSASAATALATGVRTNNKMVGVDPAGKRLTSALEVAEESGRSTGLVTTADFFDATPAAFAAHEKSRYESESIARQMLQSGAEIIAGGGAEEFGTEKIRPTVESLADDYGYTLLRKGDQLAAASGERLLVVHETQPRELDWPDAPLSALARWAIGRLSRDGDGFFLLLENEGTDGSAHGNDTAAFERAVRSVDETAGVALDYADRHPDVLVIITGDHETGGLYVMPEDPPNLPLELRWAQKGHTGEAIPIFAKGPGAERFMGMLDNDEVGRRLIELLRR
jgi:alkaline phosphatase